MPKIFFEFLVRTETDHRPKNFNGIRWMLYQICDGLLAVGQSVYIFLIIT